MVLSKMSWIAFGFGALGFLGCGGADLESTALGETPTEGSAKAKAAKTILSLGDSIAFGYNPLVAPFPPSNFIGYPEVLGAAGFQVTNASCPGETSGSFYLPTAPDNGCRFWKTNFALHADYETTQSEFAVGAIAANDKFDFVTLNIGANDLFVLQQSCSGQLPCIQAGLPGVIGAYSQHLANAYALLNASGKLGKFIGVTTYATNYNDPLAVAALGAINAVLDSFTKENKGKLADAYLAFQAKAAEFGGDACAAGLLIVKPDNTCDIHPSDKGRKLLADTVSAEFGDEQ